MWNEDYRDILQSFLDEDVDFILVGAYALASHGYPRATMDIDLWVRADPDNAEKVYRALAGFGAPLDAVSVSDFSEEGAIFQIGVAPRRIDIITRISGVNYIEASAAADSVEIDGLTIKILSAEHLLSARGHASRQLRLGRSMERWRQEVNGKEDFHSRHECCCFSTDWF